MMWRVRVTLSDRPGALARLAQACGDAGVNILGMQVFPDVDAVTDEFILGAPEDWGLSELAALVERAGGRNVAACPCADSALMDQPVRYLHAAARVVADPRLFTEVAAELFDAELDPVDPRLAAVQDVIEMAVGGVVVQVRRTAAFTPSEHARAASLAAIADEALRRLRPVTVPLPESGSDGPHTRVSGDRVLAEVSGHQVGTAELRDEGEPGTLALSVSVVTAWRRRGVGSMLLREAARLGKSRGAVELVLRSRAQHPAVLPMVLGTGLSGRISVQGEELVVRLPLARVQAPTRRRTDGGTPGHGVSETAP